MVINVGQLNSFMGVAAKPISKELESRIIGDTSIITEPVFLGNAVLTIDEQKDSVLTDQTDVSYVLRIKPEQPIALPHGSYRKSYSIKSFGQDRDAAYAALEKYSTAFKNGLARILLNPHTAKLRIVLTDLESLDSDGFLW